MTQQRTMMKNKIEDTMSTFLMIFMDNKIYISTALRRTALHCTVDFRLQYYALYESAPLPLV